MPVQVYHTGDSIQEIIKTVRTEAVKANLDPHFGGAYFEGNETFWQMLMIVIVALLMLYFILASQFESLTLPFDRIDRDSDRCGDDFAGIVDLWDLTESDVDDRYRGHEWYRDQRLDSEDRYDHPASTTGISFAGSHSRRWGEAVEADSDDEFDYYFCFDPFFYGVTISVPNCSDRWR